MSDQSKQLRSQAIARRRPYAPRLETLEERRLLAADVVINEIMYHQVGDNYRQEFVELFNAGDAVADLQNWKFNAGVDFVLPEFSLSPGEYLVVAADVGEFSKIHPDVTNLVGGWTGRLANRGEGLRLVSATGAQVDRVRYADEGDWASRALGDDDNGQRGWRWIATHDGDGKSLELINPHLPNDHGHNWTSSVPDGGTPGRANSVHSNDVAPLVVGLSHFPLIPTSADTVTISAQIIDESLADVIATLFYRQDGEAMFESMPLVGDGTTFTATIPALADQTIVEFFVTATDARGNARVVPTFESDDPLRTANRLYQVLDDAQTVDTWQPDWQPVTHLVMTNAERIILADIGDGPFLEASSRAQMNGTFIRVDGNSVDARYNVGIRNRGGASRVGPPNNYRVNFTHDDPFNGVVSTNLNSRYTHAQVIGNAIYRLAGMAAADARPSQVRVDGSNLAEPGGPYMFGSYVELETVTGSFPDRYFPDDRRGNLYRVIESGTETGDLRFEGTDPRAYQDTYSKRTNEEDDDWTDLIDLVNVLNNTPEADFVAEVNRVLDVDQWMRYLALDALLGNLETGLNNGRGDNFWLYRGTIDTRFKLIPHDLDTILGTGGRVGLPNRSIFSYTDTTGLERFLTHDAFVPRFYQAFVDLMEDVYNPETLFPLMDQLIGYVTEQELNDMKQFVVDRIAGVVDQLPTQFVVTSSLPIVDGYHRTALPSTELIGVANALETKSVLVNGELADWSPFTRQWSVLVDGQGNTQALIDAGASWRYMDDGSDLGGAWRSTSFDDSRWRFGPSPLGYGEGDEATTVNFGSNPNNKNITTYFRHEFEIVDASMILDLSMRLERDDGAIVYLNNQEIARSNLPSGDIDFQTVASSWIGGGLEGQQLSFNIDPSLLLDGTNVVAVEVHQVTSFDEDLRFELSLDATVGTVVGGVALNPGINRISVTAYNGQNGTGDVVDNGFIDVWYDGAKGIDENLCGSVSQFGTLASSMLPGGTLTEHTVLAPCGPAYRVTGEVIIPEDVTLTVLPGTTIFFEADSGFKFNGGQLVAEGTELDMIRFTRAPEFEGSWNGIQFVDSTADNRISNAILEYATTEEGLVGLTSSKLEINNSTFDNADFFRILTTNSSLIVRNSTFVDMFEAGEAPATDNGSEHIKGSGILAGGQLLLEGNYFGTTTGHNDSVDFDGAELPGPIPLVLNNVFAGSGDDALDLESDAYIEGNAFFNVVKDQFNTSTGDANAISAGAGRTYFVYRNTFHNVDHVAQVKDEAFLNFGYNTVDTVNISPIYFDLEDRSPGRGAFVQSSIFTNTPVTFGAADQAQELNVTNSIVTPEAVGLGTGNFVANPRLADPAHGDFSLLPGSPAIGIGFGGMNIGANVPQAAWIAGEPAAVTGRTGAALQVDGPGLTQYRFRLNGGPWSDVRAQADLIVLQDLTDGTYQVEVIGMNVAGISQDQSSPTSSKTWTVDTSRKHLYLSEVLASNNSVEQFGSTPDLIELHNDGETAIDLSGMSITDDPSDPSKFVFADGTSIEPNGYLTLLATDTTGEGVRLGFRLDADGEGVYLYGTDNGLVDSVEFGIQISDLSISRIGHDRQWNLSEPTFGQPNREIEVGAPSTVRINEWLAAGDVRFSGDFLELYNTDEVPVSLAGLYITDDPVGQPTRHQIAQLSFIAGDGFVTFDPNGNLANGANELPFGLSADGEVLALLDQQLRPIDQVFMVSQTNDVSQARTPDGATTISNPELATPGNPNTITTTETVSLLSFDAEWSYDQSGDDLGDAWRTNEFDDSQWPVGPGAFGVAIGTPPIAIGTPLDTGIVTHYFRSEFTVDADLLADGDTVFELSTLLDDGAIIYINNVEVVRLGVRDGDVTYLSTANRGIGLATVEGPFSVSAGILHSGTNLITAEVHQVSPGSADVIFGASLAASTTSTDEVSTRAIAIRDGLRVSELMYHPNGDADAEFVELTNVSDESLDLQGLTISGGVNAVLAEVMLAPGEHVVLVRDVSVFRSTYGPDAKIAATYDGKLSNGGEELVIHLPAPFDSPFDGAVLRFTYADTWYPTTDGDGYSLEIVDVDAPVKDWTIAEGWSPSSHVGGSPGIGSGSTLFGDLNSDGTVDVSDADILSAAIANHSVDAFFDLNGDNVVDLLDQTFLVEDILGTRAGDTNLDGKVDFADFLKLAANFGRESTANQPVVWSQGDFDASGSIAFPDFLQLSPNFGFERPVSAANALATLLSLTSEED